MSWQLVLILAIGIWAAWDAIRYGIEARWPSPPKPHCCACEQYEMYLDMADSRWNVPYPPKPCGVSESRREQDG